MIWIVVELVERVETLRKKNIIKHIVMLYYIFNVKVNANLSSGNDIVILIWTRAEIPPFIYMENEKIKKCSYKNCIFTANKSHFKKVTDFDVILFHVVDLDLSKFVIPEERAEKQKYIFVSHEPVDLYGIPTPINYYNGLFNLTWTYKFESDAILRYIIVKNKNGDVIGPKKDMQWMDFDDMKPTSEKIKRKLQSKYKAVVWFVTHCKTPGFREIYVQELSSELKKYQLDIDTYGHCGQLKCTQGNENCHVVVETDYYFYLAFENSLCEDYVTEKVLTATKHFAVPIVYGGADYTRYIGSYDNYHGFLPNGSYLDAIALGPETLAYVINETIYDKEKYYDFFRWHRYYEFHEPNESPETDEICEFCAFLNDPKYTYTSTVYDNISAFWTENIRKNLPPIVH